ARRRRRRLGPGNARASAARLRATGGADQQAHEGPVLALAGLSAGHGRASRPAGVSYQAACARRRALPPHPAGIWRTRLGPGTATAMLIAFNKPYGVLCQFTDRSATPRPSLAGFGLPANVYPAGRLDLDSEGLLLLTDDGALAHRLTDPRHKLEKTYWVQVEGDPGESQLAA